MRSKITLLHPNLVFSDSNLEGIDEANGKERCKNLYCENIHTESAAIWNSFQCKRTVQVCFRHHIRLHGVLRMTWP